MQLRTRNERGEGNLVGNGDNDLPHLVTHAINAKKGCDGCWMPSSRALLDGNVPLADATPLRASVERCPDQALFSTGFRSRNVDTASGYDVI